MLLGFVLYPAQRRLAPVVGQRVAAFALVCCSVALVVVPTGLFLRTALEQVGNVPTSTQELLAFRPLEELLRRRLGLEI
jgi:predicted PurR-regulated permease PerM